MSVEITQIRQALRNRSDPLRAQHSGRYFKPEEGVVDEFLGVTVPEQRIIAREFCAAITPEQVSELLHSSIHEERLTALIIWVLQFKKADEKTRQEIYSLYLANTNWINNWDLVDTSARDIVGAYVFDKDQAILANLSRSKNIWERRIAIIATFYFIPRAEFGWTLRLAEQYLDDAHHYIHKASGWALREVGKKDELILIDFLDRFAARMPRTMLRYSIERLPSEKRAYYLAKK